MTTRAAAEGAGPGDPDDWDEDPDPAAMTTERAGLRERIEARDPDEPVLWWVDAQGREWVSRDAALAADEPVAVDVDAAYRERNAVVAALIRVGGYPAQVVMAPDTGGWWIVYVETPAGQLSWHISPDDMDLFSDWPVAFGSHHSPWDGHTTDEKYRRLARLREDVP